MFCTKCGETLPEQWNFCGKCGAKVTDSPSGQGENETTSTASLPTADEPAGFVDVTPDMLAEHGQAKQNEVIRNLEAEIQHGRLAECMALFEQFKNKGVDYVQQTLQDELAKWKKIPINIAITGESGSGKSSFINSIRGITADDDGAAAVGSKETTMVCTKYPHPVHKNLVLWDLLGVGTPKFPAASYHEKVGFDKYDFFIIVSHSRFTANDLWLAKAVSEKKKKFYFIRTKADNEVKDDRQAHPKTHDAAQVIAEMRNDCEQQLIDGGIKNPEVFVINSYNQNEYDFEKLQLKLIKEAPMHKRDAVILSFPALNPGVIEQKKEVLAGRKWKIAILASMGSAVPIPGVGMACEAAVLLSEGKFYCEQLGMDENSVSGMAEIMKLPVQILQEKWQIKLFRILTDVRTLTKYMGELAISETIESFAKTYMPIIGSFIAVAVSYPFCVYSLQTLLDMCVKEALSTRERFTTWLNSETPV